MNLSFQFKIDSISKRENAPSSTFANGFWKPPVERAHCRQTHSTGWLQWSSNGVTTAMQPSHPPSYHYSTSIFYDGYSTSRFLFHPGDCQTVDISEVEKREFENWGWQHLRFSKLDPAHASLDHDGEFAKLCGAGGTYIDQLLPSWYQSNQHSQLCGLSGKLSLLLALTAFSCGPHRMTDAISHRLNLKERRWDNFPGQNWGNGRKVYFRKGKHYCADLI